MKKSKRVYDDAKIFGEHVKYLRKGMGFDQGKFAKKCGLSQGGLSKLEAGIYEPSLSVIINIMSTLGVGFSDLFPVTFHKR